MDYKIFNGRMRQLVESSGKLYKDVASDLGIAAPTLTRYMTGERVPELTYLVRVCEHFHVSLDWLIGLSGDNMSCFPRSSRRWPRFMPQRAWMTAG